MSALKKYTFAFVFAAMLGLASAPAAAYHVDIAQPTQGQAFQPGDTITVVIKASAAIQTALILADKPLPSAENTPELLQYKIHVPVDMPVGTYRLKAMSEVKGQLVESAPTNIKIVLPPNPLKILCEPPVANFVGVGNNIQLKVFEYFPNGTKADVARDPSITYESSNPKIVTSDSQGVLSALGGGKAVITIKHDGLSATVDANVDYTRGYMVKYDFRMVAISPVTHDKSRNFVVKFASANYGNVPINFIVVTSATLDDKATITPLPAKKELFMKAHWPFELSFPPDARKTVTTPTGVVHVHGIYSGLPPKENDNQEFDFEFQVNYE